MSQGRRGEALLMVRRTIDICGALEEGFLPSYDFRCVTARLLVELSQYELAEAVLVELVTEDAQDTEVWYLLGLSYLLLGQPRQCREALAEAKALLERGGTHAEATLMEQIDNLLQRRAISEEEKTQFWNPRWWINDDGTADAGATRKAAAAGEASGDHAGGVAETSIVLGGSVGSKGNAEFASIPEEPDDARMLLAV
jgi:tetratricopeptide (TPR) repeat protein